MKITPSMRFKPALGAAFGAALAYFCAPAAFAAGQDPETANHEANQHAISERARVRTVTPHFSVARQLTPADIQAAAAQGYTRIINNRPDGESADQPNSAQLAAAAELAGIDYVHIPFSPGHITPEALAQTKASFAADEAKTLSFCRSGTRAITIWAMAQSALGTQSPDEAIAAAKGAGYDLQRHKKRLETLASKKD